MFFVFNNECHRAKVYTRASKTNTRGKFNTAVLKERFGKKYKIWKYGSHPVQEQIFAVHKISMLEPLNGHILEITDDDNAFPVIFDWKPYVNEGTEFVGAYRNFDFVNEINFEPLKALIIELNNIDRTRKAIDNFNRSGQTLVNVSKDDKITNRAKLVLTQMKKEHDRLFKESVDVQLECLIHEIEIGRLLNANCLKLHN